jgi:hypothetical protein
MHAVAKRKNNASPWRISAFSKSTLERVEQTEGAGRARIRPRTESPRA